MMARRKLIVRINPGQHDSHVIRYYLHLIMTGAKPEPGTFIGKIMI